MNRLELSPTIIDSRGARWHLCRAANLARGWSRLWVGRCEQALIAVAMLVLPAVLIAALEFLGRSRGAPRGSVATFDAPLISLLFVVGLMALLVLGRYLFKRLAVAELLRDGLCPACTYEILDLPLAPDRCTVCPECGAAWRLQS
jgi:hypothetical protein